MLLVSGVLLRVDGDEALLSDAVLADRAGQRGAIGVQPVVDARPAKSDVATSTGARTW